MSVSSIFWNTINCWWGIASLTVTSCSSLNRRSFLTLCHSFAFFLFSLFVSLPLFPLFLLCLFFLWCFLYFPYSHSSSVFLSCILRFTLSSSCALSLCFLISFLTRSFPLSVLRISIFMFPCSTAFVSATNLCLLGVWSQVSHMLKTELGNPHDSP
jgi:hypothetical protein